MVKLKLRRALRKKLKQGYPWVYKDAFELIQGDPQGKPSFASMVDAKGEVCKGVYDPTSRLGFRILGFTLISTKKINEELIKAYSIRKTLKASKTNGYRLIAGEGDGFAGFVCDVYNSVVVFQFDGEGMEKFWLNLPIADLVLKLDKRFKTIVLKSRQNKNPLKVLAGNALQTTTLRFKENNILFEADLVKAQKTGFFLDQRDNREYVGNLSKGKTVWNIFSYTGGFSIYAGIGGALKVYSVDISKGAIKQAVVNWKINGLCESKHEGVCCDAFEFLKAECKMKADIIIIDPPSMTSSKDSKKQAVKKYINLFLNGARHVKSGGDLVLSSCSSQISFKDFREIVLSALSLCNRKGKVLRVSGQGLDHPYPHVCEELRYLKFMHIVLD